MLLFRVLPLRFVRFPEKILLLHDRVGEGGHQVVHFLFGADIVGFVQDSLLLGFVHGGVGVHGRLVHSQRHAKPYRNFVEIHNNTSSSCRIQHVFDKDAVSRCGIIYQHMGHSADQFSVLNNW